MLSDMAHTRDFGNTLRGSNLSSRPLVSARLVRIPYLHMRTCGRSVGTKIALGCGGSTHTAASTSWVLRAFRHSILLASLADVEEQQLYDYALKLSREEDYKGARQAFEVLLRRYPFLCKAWVSYAQVKYYQCMLWVAVPWLTKWVFYILAKLQQSAGVADRKCDVLQMEKRIGRRSDPDRMEACRVILQRGLQLNPSSACLAQVLCFILPLLIASTVLFQQAPCTVLTHLT